MLAFLQNLMDSNNLDEDTVHVVTMLITQANMLTNLVNNQSDIKLIEDGQFEPIRQKFKIKNLFDFICDLFQQQIELFEN